MQISAISSPAEMLPRWCAPASISVSPKVPRDIAILNSAGVARN